MTTSPADIWLADQKLQAFYAARPSLAYQPGRKLDLDGNPIDEIDNGQLQFHRAPHVFRFLAPGNGFGKTASVAVEADWWIMGDHPFADEWADPLPNRPRQVVWACMKYQQWEIMRPMIEKWWIPESEGRRWIGSPKFKYTWPNGSELFIITAQTDWKTIQGIEPDLVVVDEECPKALFRELVKRRRGLTRTRFIVSATATQGLQWPYYDYYQPWLEHHRKAGLDERQAMRVQSHRFDHAALRDLPGIWYWPMGSHRDNPTATPETWALYLSTTKGSAAERHVRLYGGFREFAGTPVFDLDNLEAMRAGLEAGVSGKIIEVKECAA